jgi:tetratricopeptide (TPR) repeat protein
VDRKKQLLYRISQWGFEKNVKKNERRAIIEQLDPELEKVEIEARTLRGRTLDAAKLNRWMRLEKVTSEESLVENNEVACVPGKFYFYWIWCILLIIYCEASLVPFERNFRPAYQDSEKQAPAQTSNHEEQREFDLQVQESQSTSVLRYNDNSFDWNSVDVIGSPGLTKLIGALTIEECDIPLLDLASDNLSTDDILGKDLLDLCGRCDSAQEENIISRRQSWSTRLSTSMKASQTFGDFEKSSHFGLQFELYPFPTPPSQPYVVRRQFFSSGSLKSMVSESECKMKLQTLKYMQDAEIIHLTKAMGARAEDLFNQGSYATAETWFRRVVRAKSFVKWYKPHQTLWACLQVAECLQLQSRFREAQQLQQDLHSTIERIFSADHDVCVQSMELNAEILGILGFAAEEETIRRQVLQMRLITLGMRHPETISALENLGAALDLLDRRGESLQLMEVSLHFWLERVNNSGGPLGTQRDILWNVSMLAQVLREDGRYDENENVLDFVHNSFADATRLRRGNTFEYHYERALSYKLQKRFEKSKKILRGLLKYHLNYMSPTTSMRVMCGLAGILMETGRHREAASWYKKQYRLSVKIYGLTDEATRVCCEDVGFCYADQSRYNEGKLFFKEVIEMLDSSSEEPNSRTSCIREINAWIERLEEMRMEDSMEWSSKNSESVDSEREPIDNDDDDDYEDMSDIPDPLDY